MLNGTLGSFEGYDDKNKSKCNRNAIYTALTRSMDLLHIFTDKNTTEPEICDLVNIVEGKSVISLDYKEKNDEVDSETIQEEVKESITEDEVPAESDISENPENDEVIVSSENTSKEEATELLAVVEDRIEVLRKLKSSNLIKGADKSTANQLYSKYVKIKGSLKLIQISSYNRIDELKEIKIHLDDMELKYESLYQIGNPQQKRKVVVIKRKK